MKCLLTVLQMALFIIFSRPAHGQESQNATHEFHKLLDDAWEFTLKENPLLATSRGDLRYNDQLRDESPQAYERRQRRRQQFLDRLGEINREALGADDQLNYDMFGMELRWGVREYEFGSHLAPVHQRRGFHLSVLRMHERVPLRTRKHYEDYLARLRAIPVYISQVSELMKAGLEHGITPPQLVLEAVPQQIDGLIGMPIEEFPLYKPFLSFPKSFDEQTRGRLREQGQAVLNEEVLPAFAQFKQFFTDQYMPEAKTDIGISARHPQGEEFYNFRVRRFTTTSLTPQAIHDLGLQEVARIKKRMLEVIEETGFEGSFDDFVHYLRTGPQFYFEKPEELLIHYRDICKRMDAELPKLFGKLPRAPYGVREIPEYEAPRATTAYYNRPTPDGRQPGWFYANTYDLKSRPKYEMEALAFHEAVPGHHLQIALQQELENVPPFRTLASITAFIEGWGLYSESLGEDVGFYQDPYSEFGALSYEMWRALRLVVDTGIHAFGWSRERAIEYMLENSALTRTNVTNEVDRYIAWPGQAVAYKIGQMKIRELRTRADEALGEDFEVRDFHDLVLGAGAIPLDILERRVEAWIQHASANRPQQAAGDRR